MGSDHPLNERARLAPELPGVYQFQDARGRVLYVGKAKHIRKRVLSYFSKQVTPRIAGMLVRARALEFVVTATEVEALILENRLIKQHRPRYNILLRRRQDLSVPQAHHGRRVAPSAVDPTHFR